MKEVSRRDREEPDMLPSSTDTPSLLLLLLSSPSSSYTKSNTKSNGKLKFLILTSLILQLIHSIPTTNATITLIGTDGKYYETEQERRFGHLLNYGIEYVARMQYFGSYSNQRKDMKTSNSFPSHWKHKNKNTHRNYGLYDSFNYAFTNHLNRRGLETTTIQKMENGELHEETFHFFGGGDGDDSKDGDGSKDDNEDMDATLCNKDILNLSQKLIVPPDRLPGKFSKY